MSDCACIVADFGCHHDLHTARVSVSRKPRVCGECNRQVSPGERYERVWGIWKGVKATHYTCSECLDIRSAFFCTWVYGILWEDLSEAFWDERFIPWSTVGQLPKPARDVFCDWVETEIWEVADD